MWRQLRYEGHSTALYMALHGAMGVRGVPRRRTETRRRVP
jgi:hypothetical protein